MKDVLVTLPVNLGLLGERSVQLVGRYSPSRPGCFNPIDGGWPPEDACLDVRCVWIDLDGRRIEVYGQCDANALGALIDQAIEKLETEGI